MKKLLSFLLAAMLLPLATSAMDLGPNQLLMGHYLTDDLATTGWGSNALDSLAIVATDITPDELALYKGGKIVAFRAGLTKATPISRVFVIPVTPNGVPLYNEMTEWACNASSKGWNLIELETPYQIDIPEGYSLRIGFDYVQETKSAKPLSVVRVGTTYPTYHFLDGEWKQLVLSVKGNLSLQCVVENDNFPEYVIRVRNISLNGYVQTGADIDYSFEMCNLGIGTIPAGGCTYEVAIDGQIVETRTNDVALTNQYTTFNGAISSWGLPAGKHTLTITPTMVNGEPIENPTVFTATFITYDYGFKRQMHLVEQFTSTWCTYCPQGTNNIVNLTNMRDDIAWVAVHENMGNDDPFRTAQCDSITNMQGVDGFPEGTFDRSTGLTYANIVYNVLTNLPAATMSQFLDYIDQMPSWATVNVNSTYDNATRKAVVTIDGDLVPGYDDLMGADSKLTVYITEDGLVAPQTSGGDNYVHNNVLREALVSVKGVSLNKTGDNKYKNTFTVNIPEEWNTDNLNIVALISRPLGNPLTDIFVTNANKRKFGESDMPASLRGDVDGDTRVNIDDVTALINYLLTDNGTGLDLEAANCDGEGSINIDDVTALINYLLTENW